MSKMSSIGALDDGMDTSVQGIEMSDINDGDILARTRENVNPNGLFQFVYIPEDGSEQVTSDWVDQEHKKKLTRVWVDGVKSAIIGRAQAKIMAAKEAAEEARAKAIRDEQFADPPSDAGMGTQIVVESRKQPAAVPGKVQVGGASDPSEYVEDQLEIARERLRAAEQAQQDITREVLTARRDYEKWKTLAGALSGVGGDSGVSVAQADQPGSVRSDNPMQQIARHGNGGQQLRNTRGQHDGGGSNSVPGGKPADQVWGRRQPDNGHNTLWTPGTGYAP
jgi:hypothetical protein